MPTFSGGGGTVPAVVIVGSKSMRILPTTTSPSVNSTQSLGDLSAYSGVSSGTPTSGTIGLWIFVADATSMSAAPVLQIGSSNANYVQVTGQRTYTNGTDWQAGWNYWVFPLINGTKTGTPVWTSVAWTKFSFSPANLTTFWCDYYTIGKGNQIGNNGFGGRRTVYQTTTTNP